MAEERANYATVDDVIALYRPLTSDEVVKTESLLPVISDRLRYEAEKVGLDLDAKIEANPVLANVARSVTVDIVARTLMTPTTAGGYGPMTNMTQSAGGYSVGGTFLNPGGGLFIKNSELQALGIRRQRYGGLGIYADPRNPDKAIQ
jgi:hypothetical protein